MNRRAALDALYEQIAELREQVGEPRLLSECTSRTGWPRHGVYLFFESGEFREDGVTPRVTRVGTHALTATSRVTLWRRLAQHRGAVGGRNPGGGNHRASIFRLHVGTALKSRDRAHHAPYWGRRIRASPEVREGEVALEQAVSREIGAMPLLWLAVDDRSDRAVIERDLIALLSNADRDVVDPASTTWLGHGADREAIRASGLWNVDHTRRTAEPEGLDLFRACIESSR
ncbi:MAG: hypothetical protein JJT89_07175 [Nitriliruptoraceae bacterium]|nr:hypothetical protein [Nitriliruptoraceae bacterium]